MLYVSYYENYPIYEPAEGGYYYEGRTLVKSERLSRRQAKKQFSEIVKEALQDEDWVYDGHWKVYEKSNYIGEGSFYCIEKKKGSHISGYKPYC